MVTRANTSSRKHFLTQRNAPYIFLLPMVLLYGVFKMVVPEFLRTLVFVRPRGDDQFADCTFSPSLDMSR